MKKILLGGALMLFVVLCVAPLGVFGKSVSLAKNSKIVGIEEAALKDIQKIQLADFNLNYGKDSDKDGLSDEVQQALAIGKATTKNKAIRKKNLLRGYAIDGKKKLPLDLAFATKKKGMLLDQKNTNGIIYEWYVSPADGKAYFFGEKKKNAAFIASLGMVIPQAGMTDEYVGSYYKGNYVYGGAMHLAWNELSDTILKDTLKLKTNVMAALTMSAQFNKKTFSKNDLDEPSYYIKSGYGQKTVDAINTESRKKFPSKSFSDLQIKLANEDIISYAYFLKQVEYLTPFADNAMYFNDAWVRGFSAGASDQKRNVDIIRYDNDDSFVLRLKLKDAKDELYLAKGFDMNKPVNAVAAVNAPSEVQSMESGDMFSMPRLHLDYHRTYDELAQVFLANKGFEKYKIQEMFENIKFDMDEKGARVENEAVISVGATAAPMQPKKIKRLVLDKPFWVIMKRADSTNPYFILGVANSELMVEEK